MSKVLAILAGKEAANKVIPRFSPATLFQLLEYVNSKHLIFLAREFMHALYIHLKIYNGQVTL
jgi:hypothetical protein